MNEYLNHVGLAMDVSRDNTGQNKFRVSINKKAS